MDEIEGQVAGWLRDRLGAAVGIATALADCLYPMLPAEEVCIAGAVAARRKEFSAGRWCAREALRQLGIAPQAILVGERMGPVWPTGSCGSITHAAGLCAAAAARSTDVAGLGIDVVKLEEARLALASPHILISTEAELANARESLESSAVIDCVPAILFSAKESAIKAMSAKFDRYVEFTEIDVRFQGDAFEARSGSFRSQASGWWAVIGSLAVTAAVLR